MLQPTTIPDKFNVVFQFHTNAVNKASKRVLGAAMRNMPAMDVKGLGLPLA